MDKYSLQEEAWKRGFERGYARGVMDQVAQAMSGAIEWHEGLPSDDLDFCYICQALGDRNYVIRSAEYWRDRSIYMVGDYLNDDEYHTTLIPEMDVLAWAEIRDPFTAQIFFKVPEPV